MPLPMTEEGPNRLVWLLRLDNKLYGNSVDPTGDNGKVSKIALALIISDMSETLARLKLLEADH